MAYAQNTIAHKATLLDHVAQYFAEFKHALAQRAEERKVFSDLSALSDKELADIGVARSDIADIAVKSGALV